MTDDDRPKNEAGPTSIEVEPPRVLVTAEMIASNVASTLRVAPALNQMLVMDDIYAFAAHLRAGSIRDTGAGS